MMNEPTLARHKGFDEVPAQTPMHYFRSIESTSGLEVEFAARRHSGLRLWHHVANHSVFCTEFSAAKFARDAHAFGDRINVVDSRKLDHLFPAGGPVNLRRSGIRGAAQPEVYAQII
jgi:hypothetical protein